MRFRILLLTLLLALNASGQSRYIHVLVALCDNENQGIVKVPANIGNGQNPSSNLYWGCGFGVKTFFKKQSDWELIKQINNPAKEIYERLIFKHKDSLVYLIADAYDGAAIKQAIIDFLDYSAGLNKITIDLNPIRIFAGGHSNLICYVGHNGLMDFPLENVPLNTDNEEREVMILACASKNYFSRHLKKTGAYPLLWTTHLMCPEAYTLDAAIDAWIKNETSEAVREKAAQSYNQYQKCGIKGARNLLVTGY